MLGLGGSYKDALKSNGTKATHQVKLTELNQEQVVGDSRENNTVDQGGTKVVNSSSNCLIS